MNIRLNQPVWFRWGIKHQPATVVSLIESGSESKISIELENGKIFSVSPRQLYPRNPQLNGLDKPKRK